MQYHSCVCILGYAEPRNWFYPGVGRGFIPLYLVKESFWDINKIILTLYFNISVEKCKIGYKKKKKLKSHDPCFPKFWVGRKRANKHFFFLGLIYSNNENIPGIGNKRAN